VQASALAQLRVLRARRPGAAAQALGVHVAQDALSAAAAVRAASATPVEPASALPVHEQEAAAAARDASQVTPTASESELDPGLSPPLSSPSLSPAAKKPRLEGPRLRRPPTCKADGSQWSDVDEPDDSAAVSPSPEDPEASAQFQSLDADDDVRLPSWARVGAQTDCTRACIAASSLLRAASYVYCEGVDADL
jgi:hypothetical protein